MQTQIDGLEIFEGALDTAAIYKDWITLSAQANLGANAIFTGIVRAENSYEGLSFDIYLPLLEQWFLGWVKKALESEVLLRMAHSKGDVLNHQSSYMAGIFSPQRRATLEILEISLRISNIVLLFGNMIWKMDKESTQKSAVIDYPIAES